MCETLTKQLEEALELENELLVESLAHELIAQGKELDVAYNALAIMTLNVKEDALLAKTYYEKAIEANVSSATLHFNLGMLYVEFFNEQDVAIDCYERAISLDKTYVDAYLELIELYLEDPKKKKVASTYADHVYALAPKNPRVLNDCGCVAMRLEKNYEKAVNLFERARLYSSDQGLIAANLAVAYTSLNQYEQAKKAYEMALSIVSNNALLTHNYAYLLHHKCKDYELAYDMYRKSIELDPYEIQPYMGIKKLLVTHLSRPKEAINILENGIGVVTEHAKLCYELAQLYDFVMEDFKKAAYYYEEVLRVERTHKQALSALAYLNVQVFHKFEEAIACFERILSIDETSIVTYINLGHVYFLNLQDPFTALSYYEKAVSLIETKNVSLIYEEELYYHLGLLNETIKKQTIQAVHFYERAIGLKGHVKAEERLLAIYQRLTKPFISHFVI